MQLHRMPDVRICDTSYLAIDTLCWLCMLTYVLYYMCIWNCPLPTMRMYLCGLIQLYYVCTQLPFIKPTTAEEVYLYYAVHLIVHIPSVQRDRDLETIYLLHMFSLLFSSFDRRQLHGISWQRSVLQGPTLVSILTLFRCIQSLMCGLISAYYGYRRLLDEY